jgi:hypothetical protein
MTTDFGIVLANHETRDENCASSQQPSPCSRGFLQSLIVAVSVNKVIVIYETQATLRHLRQGATFPILSKTNSVCTPNLNSALKCCDDGIEYYS